MRRIFKTVFSVLLMVAVLSSGTFAASDDITLFGETEEGYSRWIESVCVIDGVLYLKGDNIFEWKPGDAEPGIFYELYPSRNVEAEETAENATAPEETAAASEEAATGPEETPAAPEETPVAPEETPAAPEETPVAPEETAAAPEETAAAPEETAAAPQETAAASGETPVDETQAPEIMEIPYTYGLINFGGKLMTVDVQNKTLSEVRRDGFFPTEYKVDLDTLPGSTGEMYSGANLVSAMLETDGKFFVLARPSESDWNSRLLYEVDLKTGQLTALTEKKEYISTIAPYKPGKLLVAINPAYTGGGASEEDYYIRLRIWDIVKGQYEGEPYIPVKSNNFGGMVYEAGQDAIYFVMGNRLYKTQWDGAPEVVNYLDREYYSDNAMPAFIGDSIVLPSYNGVSICSVDPSKIPKRVLSVSGDYMAEQATAKFRAQYPDVAINRMDRGIYNMESLTTTIASGDAPDIFTFGTYGNIDMLVSKGYAMDLSDDAELMELVKELYPQLQEIVLKDGKLIGYPSSFSPRLWSYDAAAFEELGLGEFPETLGEFMDLVALWEDEYADQYPDKKLIDFYGGNSKDQLFSMAFDQYVALNETKDAPISFNTPEFRALMEKLERLPMKYSTPEEQEQRSISMVSYEYTPPLIEMYAGLMGYEETPRTLTLPPRISKSSPPMANADVTLYIVNPETKNRDIALDYIRFMAKEMQTDQRYMITPSLNEPVEDRYYKRERADAEKRYEEEKNREVEPSEQSAHEAMLKEMEHYLNVEMERWRWEISPTRLEQYRALAPDIKVQTSMLMYNSDASQEFWKIISRYQQGQLNIDQMVRELDQKAQMIFLETR